MAAKGVELHLKHPDALFEEQQPNPFIQGQLLESGILYLFRIFRLRLPEEKPIITLFLPARESQNVNASEVKEAVSRFCDYKISLLKNDYQALKKEGIKALPLGLFFLAICLTLAYAFDKLNFLPDLSGFFLREGLYIIGWVGMWKPVEIFLYELWPFRRYVRIYQYIANLEIEIKEESEK